MDERERWNAIFSRFEGKPDDEIPWLERWREILETSRGVPILDLGCGAGHDARFLTRRGFSVVAADLSERALDLTRQHAPKAETRKVDLTRGLPFPAACFRVIVASLSLHYFPWRQTLKILDDVRRCTAPDGHLLIRVNSTNDAYYGAADKREIEKNFYLVVGSPKRLFDRESVDALVATGWRLVNATERTTDRYYHEKTLWEIAVRKVAE